MYRKAAPPDRYAQPDYAVIHQELKRKGVTLQLLWEEYQKAYGQSAYRYSQFCRHYHDYRGGAKSTQKRDIKRALEMMQQTGGLSDGKSEGNQDEGKSQESTGPRAL